MRPWCQLQHLHQRKGGGGGFQEQSCSVRVSAAGRDATTHCGGNPAGPNGGTPLPKRKRGAITPSSQPKGKTPKVARSRSDSALATSSTSQKASHSGRRGRSQTRDLESMSTNCSGSDHDASARVVLVATPQDLNPAPPVNGRPVGSFSQAEPGEARDGYQSAQHHNAQRFRFRREGAGSGGSVKPSHREERPFFQGKKCFPRKKVTGPQNVQGPVLFSKLGPWKRTELLSAVCGPVQSVRPIQNGKFLIGCHSEGQQGKLSRCQSLPGGVGRIPVPTVEGVIGPRAVRITFEGCTLPTEADTLPAPPTGCRPLRASCGTVPSVKSSATPSLSAARG